MNEDEVDATFLRCLLLLFLVFLYFVVVYGPIDTDNLVDKIRGDNYESNHVDNYKN